MNPATASFTLFIVIVLCGYVISHAQGGMKIAAFVIGLMAAGLSFYIYWRKR